MTAGELQSNLEFRDEETFRKHNKTATCNHIKETPAKKASLPGQSAKEKMIADMKAKLLAPMPCKKSKTLPKEDPASIDTMDSKYNKNMSWGTPRLVGRDPLASNKDGHRVLSMNAKGI